MKSAVRLFLIGMIVFVGILYFRAITRLSGAGDAIVDLERQTRELEKQNRALLVMIGDHGLLDAVKEHAQKQGMVATAKFVYIETPQSSLAVSKR